MALEVYSLLWGKKKELSVRRRSFQKMESLETTLIAIVVLLIIVYVANKVCFKECARAIIVISSDPLSFDS